MMLKIRCMVIEVPTKPETKRNLLVVSFHSGLLAVSFYLLVRAVPYANWFVLFLFGFYYISKTLAVIIPPLCVLNVMPGKIIGM